MRSPDETYQSSGSTPQVAGEISVTLAVLAIFSLLILRGVMLLPGGFDGSGGLASSLCVLGLVTAASGAAYLAQPGSRLASTLFACSLLLTLSLISSLAAAASAIGGGDYIDPWLHYIDRAIAPFYDWKAVAIELPRHEQFYTLLNYAYTSLNWQPFVLLLVLAWRGDGRRQVAFATAWGAGLLICILPFHWFPAVSPYNYYGIGRDALPGNLVGLPWDFLPALEALRAGQVDALGMASITGMITIPSFHACGATILAGFFRETGALRWPFVLLNLAMSLAAIPIGSHYVIDIVAGVGVGLVSLMIANRRIPSRVLHIRLRCSPVLQPQSAGAVLHPSPLDTPALPR